MDEKQIKMLEMVLAANAFALRFQTIDRLTFKDWYLEENRPSPILAFIFCVTFYGYVPIFVFIVTSAISFKTPSGKYADYFSGMALFLYIFSEMFFISEITSFREILATAVFLALVIVLALDLFDQI